MAEEFSRSRRTTTPGESSGDLAPPPLRVAVALSDAEKERALLRALSDDVAVSVAARCLAADEVLACATSGGVDAAVVATDLHRLSRSVLESLVRTGLPLVLLTPQPDDARWESVSGQVLPIDTEPLNVREAILAAVRGQRHRPTPDLYSPPRCTATQSSPQVAGTTAVTIAVVSGKGSPGGTLVAVNLATALGAASPTILVDADLSGPSVAAHLDADPTRNLFMLAHADPQTPGEWDRALAEETQQLDARSPHGAVLCGVPKVEMRSGVSDTFFERLLIELERCYRFVVLDLGADTGLHHLAAARSQHILSVVSADVPGLWHARIGLSTLSGHLETDPNRLALIINRHDKRYHHRREEIEWALGHPAAAVIPFDQVGIQRSLAAQRPVVLDRHSRAGRALLDLAERVHGNRLRLPPEPSQRRRFRLPSWLPRLRPTAPWRKRVDRAPVKGGADAHDVVPVR